MKHNFNIVKNPLQNLLEKYQLEEPYFENVILSNWSKMIDKVLLQVIKPVSLKDHVLSLKIIDESWKSELEKQKAVLINKLNKQIDKYTIKEIHYIK